MKKNEETAIALESRAYNYLLLQSLFGNEPTKELIDTACSEVTHQSFEVFSFDDDSPYALAMHKVFETLNSLSACSDEILDEIKSAYSGFFIMGPLDLKAPPWESLHTTKNRSLFSEETLEVRNTYRAQGFLPAEYPHVADDHIALEFAFMTKLADRAKEAYDAGETETVKTALEASLSFIQKHLLVWIDKYAAALNEIDGDTLYSKMALFAAEFMRIDKGILEEILAEAL